MKRALEWTLVLGMGAALATGCVSRQQEESGMGGSGQSQSSDQLDTGAYTFGRPQPVPKERRAAPLWVGGGMDSARTMAQEQLKSY